MKSEKVNFMLFQYLSQMMLWIKYDGLYIIRYARVATTYFIITLYISYDLWKNSLFHFSLFTFSPFRLFALNIHLYLSSNYENKKK